MTDLWGRTHRYNGQKRGPKRRKACKVLAWFQLLKPCLEAQPDNGQFHVNAPTKGEVFRWYQRDRALYPTIFPEVHPKYFNQVWRELIPEIKLRKVLRFTRCKTCEALREKAFDCSASQMERSMARCTLEHHYRFVKRERAEALRKAMEAVMRSWDALSIAIDGTSQLPRGLPQFGRNLHGEEKSINRLHHHMTLVVVHGLGTRCYVNRDNVASDPNSTVEVLQRTLQWVEDQRGRLPGKLYIQVDNCWRENKNSTFLNFCASLVERGLFEYGIEVAFLPVGHTHNEVDQVASRISVAVRRRDVKTPSALYAILREGFPEMDVIVLQNVADTKKFLNPSGKPEWTGSRWKPIHNVTEHRYFRFSRDAQQTLVLHHKADVDSEYGHPYYPLKGTGPHASQQEFTKRVLQADGYGTNAWKRTKEEGNKLGKSSDEVY